MKMLKAASSLSSFSSLTLCEMQFSSNKPHTHINRKNVLANIVSLR